VLLAPYGLSDPTSLLAAFTQAVFFTVLVLVLVGVAGHSAHLLACITLIAGATLVRLAVPAESSSVQALADIALVVCGLVAMWMSVARILNVQQVTAKLITASVGLYLLAGITWAIAFHAIEMITPGSFGIPGVEQRATAADLYYFSFVTLTTLGYGDISPATPFARSLAVLEATFGQVFLVALLGRLVSLQLAAQRASTEMSDEGAR